MGYGGRSPEELVGLLAARGVRTVVDVRLRPERASMGTWVKARDPERGIAGLLARAGFGYVSLVELGNLFIECEDWQARYERLVAAAGDLLTERLAGIPEPFCLLCAEQDPERCHRASLARWLAARGHEVEHIR